MPQRYTPIIKRPTPKAPRVKRASQADVIQMLQNLRPTQEKRTIMSPLAKHIAAGLATIPYGAYQTIRGMYETAKSVPEMMYTPLYKTDPERYAQQAFDIATEIGGAGTAIGTAPQGSLGIFAGRRAKTSNFPRFQEAAKVTAKRLKAKGKPTTMAAGELRRKTGWFKGEEGKWRFEIDDSKAHLTGLKPGAFVRKNTFLEDVITHDELFRAYPELREIKVQGGARPGSASYNHETNVIRISEYDIDNLPVLALKTLIHEIQHSIQEIEGFARGGNVKELYRHPLSEVRAKQLLRDEGLIPSMVSDKHMDMMRQIAARDLYKRLLGEREAREASSRAGLSVKELLATAPKTMLKR